LIKTRKNRLIYQCEGLIVTKTLKPPKLKIVYWGCRIMKIKPWSIGRVAKLSNRKLYGYALTLKTDALRAIGILEEITDIFAKRGIPIIDLETSCMPEAIRIIIYVDLTNVGIPSGEVSKKLSEVKFVRAIDEIKPINEGLIIDYVHFPPVLMGDRVVLLRKPVFDALIKGGYEKFGSAYAVFLYNVGFKMGIEGYKSHLKLVGNKSDTLLKFGGMIFEHVGFGIVEVEGVDKFSLRATCKVYKSCECELFKGANEPSSHFIRGMLAGWFTGFFNQGMIAKEIECIAKGDEYCRFKILRKY